MNRKTVLLCVVGPFLALLPGAPERVAFHPAPGTAVQRTFNLLTTVDASSIALSVGRGNWGGDFELIPTAFEERWIVRDEFLAVEEDRATKLQRTYVDLTGKETMTRFLKAQVETSTNEQDYCDLKDKSVRFEWDEGENDYRKTFVGRDEGLEPPQTLRADMDMTILLPRREVAVGDTWEVDADSFVDVLRPGGMELRMESLQGQLTNSLPSETGTFRTTLQEIREHEGGKQAVLKTTARIKLRGQTEPSEPEVLLGVAQVVVIDYELEFDIRGELVWNLSAGRMDSAVLQSDFSLELQWNPTTGERPIGFHFKAKGHLEVSGSVEPVKAP